MLLLHPSVLHCRQYLTQQWTCPGAAASASTLCCATLPPRQLGFFPCRHPRFTASIRLTTQHKASMFRAINLLLGRSLLCDAHHQPSVPCQSLPKHKAVFCLLSTHNLGSFSMQTCQIVPVDEVVIYKLQGTSITSTHHPVIRVETWHQGVRHLVPTAWCFVAAQCRVPP